MIDTRHGSILCIAEICKGLAQASILVPVEVQKLVLGVIVEIERHRLFRGRGGEMIREAICKLIETVAFCKFSLTDMISSFPDTIKSASKSIPIQNRKPKVNTKKI